MSVTQIAPVLHPLCYEHHTEMEHRKLAHAGHTYVCQESACIACYDATNGYFLDKEGPRSPMERYTLPRMPCPSDARPMYLVEVQQEHPTFLVWRCPKCHRSCLSGQFWSRASA